MLARVRKFTEPFEYFTADPALSAEQCRELDALFANDLPWREHGGSFYEVSNCDVSNEVSPRLRQDLTKSVSQITGLVLLDQVQVTLQLMMPGQQVGNHSDRPLVGYEAVRLVVQLNADWTPADGGVLCIHPKDGADSVSRSVPPLHNSAFGFVMREGSHHSVTRVTHERRSVVFNFWHVGNSQELAERVQTLFSGINFADLPEELAPTIRAAEAEHDEAISHRAGCVALALMRWGYPPSVQLEGYRQALSCALPTHAQFETSRSPAFMAVAIGCWAAQLYLSDYDVDAWQRFAERILERRGDLTPPLQAFCDAAFPDPSGPSGV
jgi:hypothetical protein